MTTISDYTKVFYSDKIGNTHIIGHIHNFKKYHWIYNIFDYTMKYIHNHSKINLLSFQRLEVFFIEKGHKNLNDYFNENVFGEADRFTPNRIYIYIDTIYFYHWLRISQYYNSLNIPPAGMKEVNKRIILSLISTISHELVHLWQFQVKKLNEVRDRNFDRSKQAVMISKSIHDLNWASIRSALFKFVQSIIYEGLAQFIGYYTSGHLDLSDNSIKNNYAHAYKASKKLNKEFGKFVNYFIKGSDKYLDNFKKESISLTYLIGPHIYQFILAKSDYPIEYIGKMNYMQILKLYEELCSKYHLNPVIGIDKGIFSYGNNKRLIRKIRKKQLVKV